MEKWILSDADSSSGGITNDRIFLRLNYTKVPDSLQLYIYKLSAPYNYNENLKIVADFLLKRD